MVVVLTIERVLAWEALDSRGMPTVACAVILVGGAEGVATVPSGASMGTHEADERRDGGARYGGKGVRNAVAAVNDEIANAIRGLSPEDQEAIDRRLRDSMARPRSTPRRECRARRVGRLRRRGGGGTWSPALARLGTRPPAAAPVADGQRRLRWSARRRPRRRAGRPRRPRRCATFAEAIEWSTRVRTGTADVLREREHDTALVADEGGLAAPLGSNREAVEVVAEGIERSGLVPGEEAAIAVDVAATQLGEGDAYRLASEGRVLEPAELVAELRSWCDDFPIVSIEDPLSEDDRSGGG